MKVVAFYLPQFHSFPENDAWWGKGFTEWTNTKKSKPLFKGHYQPHTPYKEHYYDLVEEPDVMVQQAKMAKNTGLMPSAIIITGFPVASYSCRSLSKGC